MTREQTLRFVEAWEAGKRSATATCSRCCCKQHIQTSECIMLDAESDQQMVPLKEAVRVFVGVELSGRLVSMRVLQLLLRTSIHQNINDMHDMLFGI